MMIARWHIDARFGHKPELLELMRGWSRDIAPQIGWTADKMRIATGSIGAHESTIEIDVTIRDLKELDDSWSKLGTIDAHKKWSKTLEPLVVSGTPRWEIYRVI